MKRTWLIAASCLCGLAFAGAALLESTRHADNMQYGLFSTSTAAQTPKLKLWPLDGLDVATFLICAVCLSLAGGAGIGGGAVLVPCFILVRGWPTSVAVAMSNVTVLGGSFANFICNVHRHRTNGSRTVDWELILMMEPTTIAGAIFGAILNKLLPVYLTTYLLTLFITFMAIRLYQKGRQAYAKETALIKAAKQAARAAAKAAAAAAAPAGADLEQDPFQIGPAAWQQQPDQPVRTSLTIRTVNSGIPRSTSRSISRSLNRSLGRSFTNSVSRSFSRLNSQLITDTPRTPGSRTTPTAAAAAAAGVHSRFFQQQQQQPGDNASGAAITAVEAGGDVHWLSTEMIRENSDRRLLDLISCSTLCQGDVIGDVVEPIIAVPLITDLSSSSSSSSNSEAGGPAAAAAAGDLETAYNQDLDDHDDELTNGDLRQPLLAANHTAAAAAAAAAARDSSSSRGLLADQVSVHRVERVDSPDGVMVVDHWGGSDDLEDGRIDTNGAAAAAAAARAAAAAGKGLWNGHGDSPRLTTAQTPRTPKAAAAAVHQEPSLPLPHFFTLVFLSAWVVASDIAQSNTVCGSWQYWAVTLSVLAPVTIILLTFRQKLLKKYRHDELPPGTELPEGQLHWNRTTTLLYPALCSSAGLIAGLFGIGGGVVKGPLMLELGVPPDVAAATSATMIMFTAASACVVYSRFGQLLVDYGVAMLIMGFCVTLGSQLLTFILIKLLGRRSVIIFMMVVLMSMACSIMLLESVQETLKLISDPSELRHFGHLCPPAKSGVGCFLSQLANKLSTW